MDNGLREETIFPIGELNLREAPGASNHRPLLRNLKAVTQMRTMSLMRMRLLVMGEGEGTQDVTDQIEDEEQLLGLKSDDPGKEENGEKSQIIGFNLGLKSRRIMAALTRYLSALA